MKRSTITIDATDRVLGRLATEISLLLRGKNKVDYAPNKDIGDVVKVINFAQVKITGQKKDQKMYYRHSGYMGGLTETPMSRFLERKPQDVLKFAVMGMLPKNKLRNEQIKRLKVVL